LLYFVAVGKKTRSTSIAHVDLCYRERNAFLLVSTHKQHTLTYS